MRVQSSFIRYDFSESDCDFFYRMQWVVWMSMMLFRWSDCDVFLCDVAHEYVPHPFCVITMCDVQLWYVIPNYLNIYLHICHGISIFPFGDLSAPGASLRLPALVTLAHDTVKACGTGDVVCKWQLPGLWRKPHHQTSGRCRTSRNDVAWCHLPALPSLNTWPDLYLRSLTISHLAAWTP